jgi:protoporphyrinogen oxidase
MLERPRSSKIYYKGKFFSYPLKASEALFKLGIFESVYCILSYLKSKIFPIKNPENFEDWVINQFGRRLYFIFLKRIPKRFGEFLAKKFRPIGAAQRIKGLSLFSAIKNAFFKTSSTKNEVIKTLIDSFRYPKKGPGQMWQTCLNKCLSMVYKLR